MKHPPAPSLPQAAAAAGTPAAASATPSADPALDLAAIDEALRTLVEDPHRPLASLSVLAIRQGAVVHEAHFGWRSVEQQLPADGRTLYRIASVSKLVTAIAVMQLVEAGRLALDADVSQALGFALRHPAHPHAPLTVRMLMSHTSSLRDPDDLLPVAPGQSLEDALAGAQARAWWAPEPDRGPASGWFQYANTNQVVLGTVVEQLTGRCFDEQVRASVLGPLGIAGGFLPARDLAPGQEADLATLYRRDAQGGWMPQGPDRTGVRTAPMWPLADYAPGRNAALFGPQGSMRVSVPGLGRLMRALLAGGALDGVRILREETLRAMLEPQWRHDDRPGRANGDTLHGLFRQWGLGMQRFAGGVPGGMRGAGHLGQAWGLLSGFVFDPEGGGGVVYAMGGTSAEPDQHPGLHSAFSLWEERVLELLGPLTRGSR
jgi:CubicO group peptidase (beta-lactamase class C family)